MLAPPLGVAIVRVLQHKPSIMKFNLICSQTKPEKNTAIRLMFFFLTGLLCFFLVRPSYSFEQTLSSRLTLDTALAMSLEFHPLVSAKKQEYEAAVGDLNAARWSAFPNASFSFRGFREDDGQEALNQEVLTVTQPIWTGGRLSGNIGIAKAKRDAAKFAVTETEQTLLNDTVKAFLGVYGAGLKLEISSSNVEEHERLVGIIERKVSASTSPEVDLRLAKARLAFSRSQFLGNKSALEVSRANLEQLIGRSTDNVIAPTLGEPLNFNLAEAETLAIKFSPALKKMRAEVQVLKFSETVAKSSLLPQVSLGYEKRFGVLGVNQENEQLYLGLDLQPGAGLSSRSSRIASKARRRSLEQSLATLEREVRREIQITQRELLSAKMQILPAQLLAESTSDVVASYLRQYTVGRKSWLDVLNAQRELVQAKYALVEYEVRLIMASYKMKILVGNIRRDTVMAQSE